MTNFLTVISGLPHEENIVGDRWTDFWRRFAELMRERHKSGATTPPAELMQRADYAKMEEIRERVAAIIKHPETAEAMKPWYNYLCKRPLFSDEFLHALNQENVSLIDTRGRGVSAITHNAVVVDDKEYVVDCIIFATGFDVGAPAHKVGGYQVIGRDGLTLDEKWQHGIRSVHGMQVNGFPNFYIVGGVAQGTTAFNFTHALGIQGTHAADLISRSLREGVRTIEVSAAAEDRWLAKLEEKHVDHQQFYEDCTPGFLNNEGDFKDRPTFVGGTYGGGPLEYELMINTWREDGIGEDTVITYL
jgi:cyclohexanone monooxygenase